MGKNVKRKTFGTHRTVKIAIFQKISMVPCFVRETAPSYQVLSVIGENSIFRHVLTFFALVSLNLLSSSYNLVTLVG